MWMRVVVFTLCCVFARAQDPCQTKACDPGTTCVAVNNEALCLEQAKPETDGATAHVGGEVRDPSEGQEHRLAAGGEGEERDAANQDSPSNADSDEVKQGEGEMAVDQAEVAMDQEGEGEMAVDQQGEGEVAVDRGEVAMDQQGEGEMAVDQGEVAMDQEGEGEMAVDQGEGEGEMAVDQEGESGEAMRDDDEELRMRTPAERERISNEDGNEELHRRKLEERAVRAAKDSAKREEELKQAEKEHQEFIAREQKGGDALDGEQRGDNELHERNEEGEGQTVKDDNEAAQGGDELTEEEREDRDLHERKLVERAAREVLDRAEREEDARHAEKEHRELTGDTEGDDDDGLSEAERAKDLAELGNEGVSGGDEQLDEFVAQVEESHRQELKEVEEAAKDTPQAPEVEQGVKHVTIRTENTFFKNANVLAVFAAVAFIAFYAYRARSRQQAAASKYAGFNENENV